MRFILAILCFFSMPAFSETFDVARIQSSKVEWVAVGSPGFLKVESKNAGLSGDMTIDDGMIIGHFVMKIDDIRTGIKLRDDHAKEKYLEMKKYPEAKFALNAVKVSSSFEAKGIMSMHGVDKEMTWACQAAKNDGTRKISCVSKIVLTDFNVAIPSYLGVTIAKDVKVKVVLVI